MRGAETVVPSQRRPEKTRDAAMSRQEPIEMWKKKQTRDPKVLVGLFTDCIRHLYACTAALAIGSQGGGCGRRLRSAWPPPSLPPPRHRCHRRRRRLRSRGWSDAIASSSAAPPPPPLPTRASPPCLPRRRLLTQRGVPGSSWRLVPWGDSSSQLAALAVPSASSQRRRRHCSPRAESPAGSRPARRSRHPRT